MAMGQRKVSAQHDARRPRFAAVWLTTFISRSFSKYCSCSLFSKTSGTLSLFPTFILNSSDDMLPRPSHRCAVWRADQES